MINRSPRSKSCHVIAVMLNEGEQAKPRGKRTVHDYNVADVQAGVIARPGG